MVPRLTLYIKDLSEALLSKKEKMTRESRLMRDPVKTEYMDKVNSKVKMHYTIFQDSKLSGRKFEVALRQRNGFAGCTAGSSFG